MKKAKFTEARIEQIERPRLVGLDVYALVAEIGQHTEVTNSSDEDDIVRLQDNFGR